MIAVFTLGVLGYGFKLVYWQKRKTCTATAMCARPLASRLVKSGLWIATALIAAALAFPYIAPFFLDF
jgi:mercuric ion transport protein